MNHLREVRERQGLTQVELSFRVRMASTNISAIEAGRRIPGPKVKKILAKALNVGQELLFPNEPTWRQPGEEVSDGRKVNV